MQDKLVARPIGQRCSPSNPSGRSCDPSGESFKRKACGDSGRPGLFYGASTASCTMCSHLPGATWHAGSRDGVGKGVLESYCRSALYHARALSASRKTEIQSDPGSALHTSFAAVWETRLLNKTKGCKRRRVAAFSGRYPPSHPGRSAAGFQPCRYPGRRASTFPSAEHTVPVDQ